MAICIKFSLSSKEETSAFRDKLCTAFSGFGEFIENDILVEDDNETCILIVGRNDPDNGIDYTEEIKLHKMHE